MIEFLIVLEPFLSVTGLYDLFCFWLRLVDLPGDLLGELALRDWRRLLDYLYSLYDWGFLFLSIEIAKIRSLNSISSSISWILCYIWEVTSGISIYDSLPCISKRIAFRPLSFLNSSLCEDSLRFFSVTSIWLWVVILTFLGVWFPSDFVFILSCSIDPICLLIWSDSPLFSVIWSYELRIMGCWVSMLSFLWPNIFGVE